MANIKYYIFKHIVFLPFYISIIPFVVISTLYISLWAIIGFIYIPFLRTQNIKSWWKNTKETYLRFWNSLINFLTEI